MPMLVYIAKHIAKQFWFNNTQGCSSKALALLQYRNLSQSFSLDHSYFLIFKPTELLQCQNNHTAYQTEQVTHTHTHSIFLCNAVTAVIYLVLVHLVASDALFWWAVIKYEYVLWWSLFLHVCELWWSFFTVWKWVCLSACTYCGSLLHCVCLCTFSPCFMVMWWLVLRVSLISLPAFGLLRTHSLYFSWWSCARILLELSKADSIYNSPFQSLDISGTKSIFSTLYYELAKFDWSF